MIFWELITILEIMQHICRLAMDLLAAHQIKCAILQVRHMMFDFYLRNRIFTYYIASHFFLIFIAADINGVPIGNPVSVFNQEEIQIFINSCLITFLFNDFRQGFPFFLTMQKNLLIF